MSARQLFWFPLFALLACASAFAGAQNAPKGKTVPPAATGKSTSAQSAVAKITFRKVFKSSSPEYVEIQVAEDGSATYDIRQLDDPPGPQPFRVSAALTARIFSLAAKLHDFNGIKLETQRQIASLGEKTFRFDKSGQTYQVSFNYTLNSTANSLLQIFEGLSLQDQYVDQLSRSMRFDPLGVNDVLLNLQSDIQDKAVAEPHVLVPLLQQISAGKQYLDIARARARTILKSIDDYQNGK